MADGPNPLHDRIRATVADVDRPFGIMTRLRVVDESAAETLVEIMSDVVPPSQAEPGCLTYQVSRDGEDPLAFVLYDRWANLQAVKDHEASEYFRAGVARMKGLVAGKPEVTILSFVGEDDRASKASGPSIIHGGPTDFPKQYEAGEASTHHVVAGGMAMSFNRFPAGDAAAYFEGLPGGRCVSHHWGYQLKGKMRITMADGHEETVGPGEAYYLAPGHDVEFLEPIEQIEFSPISEYTRVVENARRIAAEAAAK